MVISQESTKHKKPIIKKGDVFVCLLCNAEIKHRNNQDKQYLLAMYALSSLVTNLKLKDIPKSMQEPFLAVTTA